MLSITAGLLVLSQFLGCDLVIVVSNSQKQVPTGGDGFISMVQLLSLANDARND